MSRLGIRAEMRVSLNTKCRTFWSDFKPNRDVTTDLFYVIPWLGFRRRVAVNCFASLQREICKVKLQPEISSEM